MRGRSKLATWLANAEPHKRDAAALAMPMLALDDRLLAGDKAEVKSALRRMGNSPLRVFEALAASIDAKVGGMVWALIVRRVAGGDDAGAGDAQAATATRWEDVLPSMFSARVPIHAVYQWRARANVQLHLSRTATLRRRSRPLRRRPMRVARCAAPSCAGRRGGRSAGEGEREEQCGKQASGRRSRSVATNGIVPQI
eukprot:IDg3070t1